MADQSFILRPANPADAPALCALHAASIRAHCAQTYTSEQIEAWAGPKRPEHYVAAMARGEIMFVAEIAAQVVGFAALATAEVKAVYVAPGHTRHGIGRALLRAVEDHAAASGAAELRVESTLNGEPFYAAHGYQRVAPAVHEMCGVKIPCVAMRKTLPAPSES
jgi:putative acetyltransferase